MTNKKTRDEEVAHARRYMAMPLTKAAMDRARGHWVPWLIEALDEAEAERDRMRDVLLRKNFAPCDTQACNCGGWHERATGDGFYARFREIEEAIGDHNGKTLLAAVVEMVQERDALKAKLAALVEAADHASLCYSSRRGKIIPSMEMLGRAVDAAKVQP